MGDLGGQSLTGIRPSLVGRRQARSTSVVQRRITKTSNPLGVEPEHLDGGRDVGRTGGGFDDQRAAIFDDPNFAIASNIEPSADGAKAILIRRRHRELTRH